MGGEKVKHYVNVTTIDERANCTTNQFMSIENAMAWIDERAEGLMAERPLIAAFVFDSSDGELYQFDINNRIVTPRER